MTGATRRIVRATACIAGLGCGVTAAASGGGAVEVPASANVWGAGHDVAPGPGGNGGGVLPTQVALPGGSGRAVRFTSVTGTIDYGPCCPSNGPEGILNTGCPVLVPWDGIAGLLIERGRFLAAVFLAEAEPADPPPASLDLTGGIDFAELSPGIAQPFFVGDGLTGTGSGDVQVFNVPDGATRLFLGVFDRCGCDQPPGWYGDNSGQCTVTYEIDQSCPADVDGSGTVDGADLVAVILDWGTDGSVNGGDVDGSGLVDGADLVAVILAWGVCP